jgi:uncharacterized Fe-S radical SAM superfamily protein PflX
MRLIEEDSSTLIACLWYRHTDISLNRWGSVKAEETESVLINLIPNTIDLAVLSQRFTLCEKPCQVNRQNELRPKGERTRNRPYENSL